MKKGFKLTTFAPELSKLTYSVSNRASNQLGGRESDCEISSSVLERNGKFEVKSSNRRKL